MSAKVETITARDVAVVGVMRSIGMVSPIEMAAKLSADLSLSDEQAITIAEHLYQPIHNAISGIVKIQMASLNNWSGEI